ncbi:uncharacterized protein LOC130414654 [Triplophysa dalaica]|uniref:uncharacterized protein LOC130414654 n=1 Tax=Triplophysa dalaica TaxID=1582913 RepID=UPI0024DFB7BF|nr:uncharacterized protein LOC130414654 [Triplophysa dalaica]
MSSEMDCGDTPKLSELRIVLIGCQYSGKSSAGNIILNTEEFDLKRTAQCVKRQREVADRHITVIEAPGWWSTVPVDQSPELLKQEILLSVSLCPPGPHVVLLVIRVDTRFKDDERKVFQGYVDLLGERVWSHTIVLFTHGDFLGDTSIEQHIEREGEDLQWLVEKCGNRYHVLNNKNRSDDTQIKDLLEKIEETVTENKGCHFEIDRKILQELEEKRRAEEERAEERVKRMKKQREMIRSQMGEKLSELRIVLMGDKYAGKSSSGNIILNREEFDLKRTAQCVKRQREVADRHITVIEAPGWWSTVPVDQSPELLKQEILLSVSLCPPGPHVVLLVVRVDTRFKDDERKVFQGFVDLLSERVWSHTIVLFTHGDFLGDTSIEQHIESEGEDLQWLVEKCGNRYHVLNNKNRSDDTQIKDLLEKIEETVTQNNGCHFEIDRKILQELEEKRRAEEERAEERVKRMKKQREKIRSQMSEKLSELRIVLMGYKVAGKSSSGNIILNREEFDLKTTAQCVKRQREVADRHITVIEAPGWWRNVPVDQSSELLKQEILLSVSLCPPGPHVVLLVVRADIRFKEDERKVFQGYVDLLSERVWSHTIVLFTFGDFLGDTSIEQHIESEGEDLQWLVEKCGNRYHVLNNENRSDDTQIKDLLEKIEETVTQNNSCRFELLQKVKEKRRAKENKAESQMMSEDEMFDTVSLRSSAYGSFRSRPGADKSSLMFASSHSLDSPLSFADGSYNKKLQKPFRSEDEMSDSISGSSGSSSLRSRSSDNSSIFASTRFRDSKDSPPNFAKGSVSSTPQSVEHSQIKTTKKPSRILKILRGKQKNSFLKQFKEDERKVFQGYVDLLGERVWSHTIVLFTHGDFLGDTSIEQHIESEGEDLQWLVEKCGNRYHVLNNKNRSDDTQIKDLLEKIEETVTQNNGCHFNTEKFLHDLKQRRKAEKQTRKEQMRMMQKSKEFDRLQMTSEKLSGLRIVLMGYKGAGKSSSGNIILNRKEFDLKRTAQCVKRQREVADRHITVIEAPGWWINVPVEESSELLKQEILLSVTLCPPGPHVVLLVIRADIIFKEDKRKVFQGYVDLLGERVWSHTIVLFTHGDFLGDTSIEQHIESEGEDLQWLVEKCGNRYHVLNNKNISDDTQIKDLLEKIEETVTQNNGCHFEIDGNILQELCHFEIDRNILQELEEKRRAEEERAEERVKRMKKQREMIRSQMSEKLSDLRIVLMGCRRDGKSSSGNIILNREEFDPERTAQCVKRQREVADRHITVIEAPGWWINVPVDQSSDLLKEEILLSVSLCPPGPHVVLLVIRADIIFKEDERKVFQGFVDLLGERVWSHTIVLFTDGDFLGETSIEQHIESEGEDLQWLVEKCGNRYHVLNNKNRSDDTQIKDLLEKIEETVTQNNGCHFEIDRKILQELEEKRRAEEERAEERVKRMKKQREMIRSQMSEKLLEFRIVLMGYKGAGKSSSRNIILNREEFDLKRTDQCVKRQREVADRHITVIEAPGWWKNEPVEESPELLKQEILLSVSLCPPGPHAVLLVIPVETRFKEEDRKVLQGYVDLLSERVWSHTIVLFTHGDFLGDTSIEQHIEREGEDLQWLVEKCGNRFHVLNNKNRSDDTQIKDLLEKIEETVTQNNGCHFEIDRKILQELEEKRRAEEERAEELVKRMKKQREMIRSQMMSEDETSDTDSLGSFDYGSFSSLSVSGENISDTVSLRTSGYGSFRSQLDNSSIFASSRSIDRPISFGNGSIYNRVIGQKCVSEDEMCDPASLRSSVSGSFRSRSDADMFASSHSKDKPISFKSGSVNPTSDSLEHSGKEAQRTDP